MPEKDIPSNSLLEWEKTSTEALKLPGLGPKSKAKLIRAGLLDVRDLVFFLPRKYRDYSQVVPISQAEVGHDIHVQGTVLRSATGKTYQRGIPYLEGLVDDGTGTIRVIWYHRPYLRQKIKSGVALALFGKVGFDRMGRFLANPQFDTLDGPDAGRRGIEAQYRQVGGLRSEQIGKWIRALLNTMPDDESLPPAMLESLGLPRRKAALIGLHQPQTVDDMTNIERGTSAAWCRLVFEEFFYFHWGLARLSRTSDKKPAPILAPPPRAVDTFERLLPFKLTQDQTRVMNNALSVLASQSRMFTLVQGDVGCGKTIVGLFVAWVFAQAGWQSALLCPTTVLADQHGKTARDLLEKTQLRIGVLHGAMKTQDQREALDALAQGRIDLVVGTHKIFQENVSYRQLGLVLVDEQHRFGVNQRSALLAKGSSPHYMTFSATPIPRSLAMAVFAGYDVQQIRQKPAGRRDIKTILKKAENRSQIVSFVRQRIGRGDRVYWVFPLIEGREDQQEKSAKSMFAFLKGEFGFDVKIALIHGRLQGSEIQHEMRRFRHGETQILVATSVIEVGVDVSTATIIVIESAQHFGLSQLHQLRGRVGRSHRPSFCFLVVDQDVDRNSLKRLRFLESCQDGFKIAEFDLQQRGFGELLGKRQSGFDVFRFGEPIKHKKWFELARSYAAQSFSADEKRLLNRWGRESWWRSAQD